MTTLADLIRRRKEVAIASEVESSVPHLQTPVETPVTDSKPNPLAALIAKRKQETQTPAVPAQRLNFAEILAKAKQTSVDSIPTPPTPESGAYHNASDLNDVADSEQGEELETLAESEEIVTGTAATFMPPERLHIADHNIPYDESQIAAVKGLVEEQYGCLIGAAGTGKTTTTRKVLDVLINGQEEWGIAPMRLSPVNLNAYHADDSKAKEKEKKQEAEIVPSIVMCAFTGQATQVIKKNMPGQWAKNVMTIHSMLGYAPDEYFDEEKGKMTMTFAPTYTREALMPWDIVIVDEASMVSLELWHEILNAAKPTTRFYFIGDLNQLTPPVGQGILGFALSRWPVFELTHVHRQKDEAANKIVDAAWNVLQGKWPVWDDFSKEPNWRVAGMVLDPDPVKAHTQIVGLAKALSKERVSPRVDPETPIIFDPWRDRILTQGNGFDEQKASSMLGQYPLNESLSLTFAEEGQERFIIDAGINKKRFAVGYRVMATKNEPPNLADRVTNGLTGKILSIEPNPDWVGDVTQVGPENVVRANQREAFLKSIGKSESVEEDNDDDFLDGFSFEGFKRVEAQDEGRNAGPASHIIEVAFDNGGKRTYTTRAQVDQLMIAYASTVHKAQGAEMPTVIIVVHHAGNTRMLNRESLYTAITRASQRVIILYTDNGIRKSLARQEIFGANLAEKVRQYQRMMGGEDGTGFKTVTVRLSHHDNENYWERIQERG